MNEPIRIDENGHILINDSMSDDLKQKIAQYNQIGDTEILEEELVDTDDVLRELDEEELGDSVDENFEDDNKVSEEELDSLNDLFI